MSLEQHNIDQGYKARLADLEVTPPAHAWAAIAAQLPNQKSNEKDAWWWGSGSTATALNPEEKSKRDRVLFWWWTGALITLTTLSLLAYYGAYSAHQSNQPNPSPNSSAAILAPIAAISTSDNSLTTSEASTEKCPEVQKTQSTTKANIKVSEKSTSAQQQVLKTRPASTTVVSTMPVAKSSLPDDVTVALASLPTKAASTQTSQLLGDPLLTDTKTTLKQTPRNPSVGLSLASSSLKVMPLSNLSLLESEAPRLPFGPGIGCEDFKSRAGWSFAVRAFAGPGMVFQEYTSSDQTASYKLLRDSIENRQMSIHGGLRFEAVNDAGLFLRAGADYQMYRSNLDYLGPPRSRTIIDSVFMEDTQTWRVETRNEVFQEQRTVYNRQHAVVLTGGIGFRKTFGNVSPYLMVEAGYEFLFKKKGNFVLPDGNFVDLAEDDQGLYINERPGLQFGGVIGVDFALTDRIEAGISGHFKQLGGLRGSADLLDYDQSTAFGALNLRYTIR